MRRRGSARKPTGFLPQIKGVPVVPLSAMTGAGMDRLLPAVRRARRGVEYTAADCGAEPLVRAGAGRHPPPLVSGRRLRLYITQAKARPPTFVAVRYAGRAAAGGLPAVSGQQPA